VSTKQAEHNDRLAREKAAILMISLGKEQSAKIFKQLSEEEIETLTLDIANMRKIDQSTQAAVLKEFMESYQAQDYLLDGGIDYAREILNQSIGQQKAYEMIGKLTSNLQVRPFEFARRLDASTLFNIIQHEQPQTIALILSYLSSRQSAQILSSLPQAIQADIVTRISKMGKTSPEHIREIERVLERRLTSIGVSDFDQIGGINTTVEILNAVDRGTEKHILETLNQQDNALVEEIKSKMFVFEDIIKLDRVAAQRVLKEIGNDVLVLALKGVKSTVSDFIFENMSKRMQEMIREEISLKGPVRVKDVEEAQQKIVLVIRQLEEAGEISILRGKEEELVGYDTQIRPDQCQLRQASGPGLAADWHGSAKPDDNQ